jgi:hypothetical protein
MASRKSTTIPAQKAPAAKAPILYEIVLPGGGKAKFYKTTELSPRRRRELNIVTSYLFPKMRAAATASNVAVDGVPAATSDVLAGLPVNLTKAETREMFEMSDLAAITYLKSWTLMETIREDDQTIRRPRPLPENIDALLDVPTAVYDAIVAHASKLMVADEDTGFSVDSVEDPESPTGDFGA